MEFPQTHEVFKLPTHGEVTTYTEAVIKELKIGIEQGDKKLKAKKSEILSLASAIMDRMDEDEDTEEIEAHPEDKVSAETSEDYQKLYDFITLHFPAMNQKIVSVLRKKMN